MRLVTRIYVFLLSESNVRGIRKKKIEKSPLLLGRCGRTSFLKFIVRNFSSAVKPVGTALVTPNIRFMGFVFITAMTCGRKCEQKRGIGKRLCFTVLLGEYCVFFIRFLLRRQMSGRLQIVVNVIAEVIGLCHGRRISFYHSI